jgi:phytoene synthase
MDENFRHCEALVRAADKDRFLSALFAPAHQRGPLFALYAFNAEIASVRDRAREPMPGEIRLQWWRDVINGERAGEAGRQSRGGGAGRYASRASRAERRCST